MIVIERKRNAGKTTILLHYMMCDLNSIYVCRTDEYAKRAFEFSQKLELNLSSERFKGMTDPNIRIAHEHGYRILVDDADFIIKRHSKLGYELLKMADVIVINKGEI